MKRTLNALWNDENGFVVSAELVLVMTIGVLAMIVGLHSVSKSVVQELNDVASAFGAIDQSFCFGGLKKKRHHAEVSGSGFNDRNDDCDCSIIVQTHPRVKTDRGGWGPEAR
jgi:Flp pilus assembly pilin Flp